MLRKTQQVIALTAMLALFFLGKTVLYSQTHISVPVDNPVYYILEQAEVRGLCSPLPAVKPYTQRKILEAINEILDAEPKRFGALTDGEKEILESIRDEFNKGKTGFDPWKGKYRFDTAERKKVRFSGDIGIAMESLNSAAYYKEEENKYIGTDTWGTFFVRGDIGEKFSFNVDFSAGMMKAYRAELGEYYTYAIEAENDYSDVPIDNKKVNTYSQPLAFFPYSYKKNWDGFMFSLGGSMGAGDMEYWPNNISIAARMESEMSASAFDDMLLIRFGRIRREWGAMAPGSSLVLNGAARPFVGIEANFNPVPWFAYSSLTGVLEFADKAEETAAMTFQNAYSIQQVELNYKNYFHIDFGSSVVWTKRLEFGYIYPLLDNFFYQNFIGDFDNMAIHLNIKGQFPGVGKIWFSFFMDELEIASMGSAFDRDRHMFAYQAGAQGLVPFLPFSSVTLSYTKIEPYNYTHKKEEMPWYRNPMETAYVNSGACIGYYLPPNSDEIKVRFETRPMLRMLCLIQYQLVRHGADYGPHQVDGSSLVSELDPVGRAYKASLGKNFLNDGAYQWMHIAKIGAEYKLKNLPLTLFGETGVVYSYFTDISDEEFKNYSPAGNIPAAGEYFKSTAFILTLGFKIFK